MLRGSMPAVLFVCRYLGQIVVLRKKYPKKKVISVKKSFFQINLKSTPWLSIEGYRYSCFQLVRHHRQTNRYSVVFKNTLSCWQHKVFSSSSNFNFHNSRTHDYMIIIRIMACDYHVITKSNAFLIMIVITIMIMILSLCFQTKNWIFYCSLYPLAVQTMMPSYAWNFFFWRNGNRNFQVCRVQISFHP